jgi:Flp pilus assembly protein TadG
MSGLVEAPAGFGVVGRIRRLEKLGRFCRKRRRRAAVVEFAIVAPLFFLLVLGMIEFGRLVMVQQILTNGAREASRLAVLDGTTTSMVQSAATTYLEASSVRGATVSVAPNPPTNAAYGAPVTVTVTIPFNQVSWLPSPMYLGGRTMTAKSVMRRETVQ